MTRSRRLGLAAALAGVTAAASIALAGPASSKPLERGTFHDEFTEILDDFCDVPGLTVQHRSTSDGRFLFNPHGRDGLIYLLEHVKVNEVLTNVVSGTSVTITATMLFKDLRVTDNGDGTLTVSVLETGNFVLYGPDGKAIARNPGQVRFARLTDHGGTPTDPFDDEILEFLGVVKEATGRSDDICAASVSALLG